MNADKLVFPVSVDIKLHVTDGTAVGAVTFGMGLHKLPTEAEMPASKGYRGPNLVPPSLEEGERWHDEDAENAPCMLFRADGADDGFGDDE